MKTPIAEIRRGLDARLTALLPDMGLEATDVAWSNAAFAPETAGLYLKPVCAFNETENASLGPDGIERLVGVYRVDVVEVAGQGADRADAAAAAVIDGFRGVVIDCGGNLLRVVKVWPGAPVEENGRFTFPVSAFWRCDISR